MRTRRDVWKLQTPWDPVLVWYARAVAEMQRRKIHEPTSWRYQAAIHAYVRELDPLAVDDDEELPSDSDQEQFWTQCQHGSWFFLPWHRMYLLCFERIVAATVVSLNGPDDWALPYWNYSDATNPNARRLPPAFTAAETPDHVDNPLRLDARDPDCNAGNIMATPGEASIAAAMAAHQFAADPRGGSAGFGGARTRFSHSGPRQFRGEVERTPHGTMHGAVGGLEGWMSAFNTAALDPLFWLHHANVDRLWSQWLRDPRNANPLELDWRDFSFDFHDDNGVRTFDVKGVIDTRAPNLEYQYDDDPPIVAAPATAARARVPMTQKIPEMVGATSAAVDLSQPDAAAKVPLEPPTGPAIAAAGATPKRVYLNLENITGAESGLNYEVYVSPSDAASADQPRAWFAGIMPTFGVKEATATITAAHGSSGVDYSLDITDVMQQIVSETGARPDQLHVTFKPIRARGPLPSIQVGRISVYLA